MTGRSRSSPLRDNWHWLVPELAQGFLGTARAGHATYVASRHVAELNGIHVQTLESELGGGATAEPR